MIKKFIFKLIYYTCSLTFILTSLEIGSRIIKPISPGSKRFDENGKIIVDGLNTRKYVQSLNSIKDPGNNSEFDNKSIINNYFVKSNEFYVKTTINKNGTRLVPSSRETSDTKLIFLGDSFTFGIGVSNTDSIANNVCRELQVNCVNLGLPGSGSKQQFSHLTNYLYLNRIDSRKRNIIVHLILASTTQSFGGNDINDTVHEIKLENNPKNIKTKNSQKIRFFKYLTGKSNLFRIIRLYFGHKVRSLAYQNYKSSITSEDIIIFTNYIKDINIYLKNENIKYYPILISTRTELQKQLQDKTYLDLQENLDFKLYRIKFPINSDNLFYKLDGHFTSNGTDHVGKELLKIVK